jgi:uncharacterized protein YggE
MMYFVDVDGNVRSPACYTSDAFYSSTPQEALAKAMAQAAEVAELYARQLSRELKVIRNMQQQLMDLYKENGNVEV